MVLDSVEFRLWLSPIVSVTPLEILTALLLPTLSSALTWLLAATFKVAGDGEVFVSARSRPDTLLENTLTALSVTAPESMVICPVSVEVVLIFTTLRPGPLPMPRSVACSPPAKVNPPVPVIWAEIVLVLLLCPPIQMMPSLPPKASVPLVTCAPPFRIRPAGLVPSLSVRVWVPRLTVVPF
jgi:hypothetical protein